MYCLDCWLSVKFVSNQLCLKSKDQESRKEISARLIIAGAWEVVGELEAASLRKTQKSQFE